MSFITSICAIGESCVAVGTSDCSLHVWDLHTAKCRTVARAHASPVTLMSGVHGGMVACFSEDGCAKVWDAAMATGLTTHVLPGADHATAVSRMPCGNLAVGMQHTGIHVVEADFKSAVPLCSVEAGCWSQEEVKMGVEQFAFRHSSGLPPVAAVACLSDKLVAAVSEHDHRITVWDMVMRCPSTVCSHESDFERYDDPVCIAGVCAASPERLVSTGTNHGVRVWDVGRGTCVWTRSGSGSQVCVLPTGSAVVLTKDALTIWDLPTGRQSASLSVGCKGALTKLSLTSSGLVCCASDSTLLLVDVLSQTITHRLKCE